jgi:predicted AlkP superfamily phosphohydrolase/phosphomutase
VKPIGTAAPATGPLVVLGLDAFEPDLLDRWSAEGRLPFLTELMNEGVCCRVRSSAFADAPWPSMVSGVSPGEHGFYTHLQLRRGTYRVERTNARHCRRLPFWDRLRGTGLNVAVFDVPKTFPIPGVAGLQICGWGEHYPLLRRAESIPPQAVPDLEARFGAYAHPPEIPAATRAYEDRCMRQLARNLDRKAEAVEYLLGLGPWDLFFAVFAEVHYADHQFLHLADESHWAHEPDAPPALRDILPRMATKLDAAVARIHERLPADANLVVVSVHGIEPNFSGNAFVPAFLERLGVLAPVQRAVPVNAVGSILAGTKRLREMIPRGLRDFINRRLPDGVHDRAMSSEFEGSADWRRTRAFMLPSDHFQAFISLNLAGREPEGVVQSGDEARALFGRLKTEFLRLVNAATGRPVVESVQWIPDLYPGEAASTLPDIVVHWSRDVPIQRVVHPDLGEFDASHQVLRKTQHTARGFLIATGPAFVQRTSAPDVESTDIAPTLLHLLGQAPDPAMAGRVRCDLLQPVFRDLPARFPRGAAPASGAERP